ncbi:hypothetical protein Hanom_Chr08g00739071 [Helianthus anomalus]
MYENPGTCMDNCKGFSVSKEATHKQVEPPRDLESSLSSFQEEREVEGPNSGNARSVRRNGPFIRPNYITCRPKHNHKPTFMAQSSGIPDLNQEVDPSTTSDPFNLEEIFRLEKEDTRMRVPGQEVIPPSEKTGDIAEDERDRIQFDEEVNRTMELGVNLGIGINGL